MNIKETKTSKTFTSGNDKYVIEAIASSDVTREGITIASGVVRAKDEEGNTQVAPPMNHLANFSRDWDKQFNFNFFVTTPAERAEILSLIEEFIAAVEATTIGVKTTI